MPRWPTCQCHCSSCPFSLQPSSIFRGSSMCRSILYRNHFTVTAKFFYRIPSWLLYCLLSITGNHNIAWRGVLPSSAPSFLPHMLNPFGWCERVFFDIDFTHLCYLIKGWWGSTVLSLRSCLFCIMEDSEGVPLKAIPFYWIISRVLTYSSVTKSLIRAANLCIISASSLLYAF